MNTYKTINCIQNLSVITVIFYFIHFSFFRFVAVNCRCSRRSLGGFVAPATALRRYETLPFRVIRRLFQSTPLALANYCTYLEKITFSFADSLSLSRCIANIFKNIIIILPKTSETLSHKIFKARVTLTKDFKKTFLFIIHNGITGGIWRNGTENHFDA